MHMTLIKITRLWKYSYCSPMVLKQISWFYSLYEKISLWKKEKSSQRLHIEKVLFFYCGNVNLSLQWLPPPSNPKRSTLLSSVSLIHPYLVIGTSCHQKLVKASLRFSFTSICGCPSQGSSTKPSPELQARNHLMRKIHALHVHLRMYNIWKSLALSPVNKNSIWPGKTIN